MNPEAVSKIHQASLEILQEVGVLFHSEEAVGIFQQHGVRVDGRIVYLNPQQVEAALATAPSEFVLHASNAARSLSIGGGDIALAPGYGAPFIMEQKARRRSATLEDYRNFCKLIHTSEVLDVTGFLMVDPVDVPPGHYHLDMLYNSMTLCDRPFLAGALSRAAAQDTLAMAEIVFGRKDKPVMLSLINSLAPLQFAGEMTEALIVFARHRQPLIIMGGGAMGSTTPIRIAGHLAVQNAVVLAGIALSQLVNPGTPVVYGTGGSPMDMQTGGYHIGGPESTTTLSAGAAMARSYRLPCRGGGALTDAHDLDFQAGMQAAMAMDATLRDRVDVVIHACGILGSFMAMSYEKFIADEEIIKHLRRIRSPVEVSGATIDLDTIREVGSKGHYLTHDTTYELCRSAFYRSPLLNRKPYDSWQSDPDRDIARRAAAITAQRLKDYIRPEFDSAMDKELAAYVAARKNQEQ